MPDERLMPKFLTRDIAEMAVKAILEAVMQNPDVFRPKRRHCHVVVVVPSMENVHTGEHPKWRNYALEPSILYEYSYGERADWEHPFADIALVKALQLWQGRNDDRTDSMPHLLFSGDTPFWGGVKRHGIVVTCSGLQPWLDKMLAGMVADACIALAYGAWMRSETHAKNADFLK